MIDDFVAQWSISVRLFSPGSLNIVMITPLACEIDLALFFLLWMLSNEIFFILLSQWLRDIYVGLVISFSLLNFLLDWTASSACERYINMSGSTKVLDPAFQGAGQKPYMLSPTMLLFSSIHFFILDSKL